MEVNPVDLIAIETLRISEPKLYETIRQNRFALGPIASLQYTNVYTSGFTETGSLAPLSIHSDSEESLRSDLGFRAVYQWHRGGLLLALYLTAAWEHEYKYSALPITAGFANIPWPNETFFGPAEGHDSAVLSVGLSAQWTPMILTYVAYEGQLGRGQYSSNAVTGGVRVSWRAPTPRFSVKLRAFRKGPWSRHR